SVSRPRRVNEKTANDFTVRTELGAVVAPQLVPFDVTDEHSQKHPELRPHLMSNFGQRPTKATRKRQVLNHAFKQFQRLPVWPIEKIRQANLSCEKQTMQTSGPSTRGAADEQARFINSNF